MKRYLYILSVAFILGAIFLHLTKPIGDPDFFWHIATGRWIVQHGHLPRTDPFSFVSLPEDPTKEGSYRIGFILRSYWLAQSLIYLVYSTWGYAGPVLLMALILTSAVFFMFLWMLRQRIFPLIALLFPLLSGLYLGSFSGLRPQLFTFAFSVLVVYLLEILLERGQRGTRPQAGRNVAFVVLPLCMMLWSNLHGGYILGEVITCIYLFSEVFLYLYRRFVRKTSGVSLDRGFIVIAVLSVIAGFINPETYHAFLTVIEQKTRLYTQLITEYMSPLQQARELHEYRPQFWAALVFGAAVHILRLKGIPLRRHLLFLLLALMGLKAVRYTVFLVLIEPLFIASEIEPLLEKVKNRFSSRLRQTAAVITCLLFVLISSLIIFTDISNKRALAFGVDTSLYPEGAVKFIKENDIKGNMFNIYDWGGYLIWELYPDVKVFQDGRGLVEEVVFDSYRVLEANNTTILGKPQWRGILDGWAVDMLLIRGASQFGQRIHGIIPVLTNDPEWALVYFDDLSLLFLRRTKFPDLVKRYELPGQLAYNQIIAQLGRILGTHPYMKQAWATMAEAHYLKGQRRSALRFFQKALSLDPDDETIKSIVEKIKQSIEQ